MSGLYTAAARGCRSACHKKARQFGPDSAEAFSWSNPDFHLGGYASEPSLNWTWPKSTFATSRAISSAGGMPRCALTRIQEGAAADGAVAPIPIFRCLLLGDRKRVIDLDAKIAHTKASGLSEEHSSCSQPSWI
jgi:hypothetical protein